MQHLEYIYTFKSVCYLLEFGDNYDCIILFSRPPCGPIHLSFL